MYSLAEKCSILDSIKKSINKSSGGFADFFGLRNAGDKVRIRFLDDFEEGVEILFHNEYGKINHPCLSYYGKSCPNCDNSDAKTHSHYVWNIYNYETKKVELFMFKANKSSPLAGLSAIYEELQTILDNDIIITRNGMKTDTTYSVVAGKEMEFTKPTKKYNKTQIYKMCIKTFNEIGEGEFYELDAEEEQPKQKPKASSKTKTKSRRVEPELDEDDEEEYEPDFEDEEDEEELPPPKKRKKTTQKPVKRRRAVDEDEDDEIPF